MLIPLRFIGLLFLLFFFTVTTPYSQSTSFILDFSEKTVIDNQITIMGGGFDALPLADVNFGLVPLDDSFKTATDGHGAIISADPGEGVMVLSNSVSTDNAALIRCNVMTDSPHTSVIIAAIGKNDAGWIAQSGPSNGSVFVNKFKRVSTLFSSSTNGFQALIQIVNTSDTEPLVAYIDNFEIILIEPNLDYSGELLDGDHEDPVDIHRTPVASTPTPLPLPTSTPTFTNPPNQTPTATPTNQFSLKTLTLDIPDLPEGAKPLEMVWIEPGTFTMGSPNGNSLNQPAHDVELTKGFYIGKYEVTIAQWYTVMEQQHFIPEGDQNKPKTYIANTPTNSHSELGRFFDKLSAMDLTLTHFRLPSEAEWEYACRAGTTTDTYWGNKNAEDYVWHFGNTGLYHPLSGENNQNVGLLLPNAFGLYDMCGNVWEWCNDQFDPNYYSLSPLLDPQGKYTNLRKVIRGGSTGEDIEFSNSIIRDSYTDRSTSGIIGFRLAAYQDLKSPVSEISEPKPIQSITIDLPNLADEAKPLELIQIDPGTFIMGSPPYERGRSVDFRETPHHYVSLTNSFYMGKFEITQAQWQAIMGNNPSFFGGNPNHPVEQISWNDCQQFLEKLNAMKLSHLTYRLPTEAEWEYACRAGTQSRYSFGDVLECEDYNVNEMYCEIMDQYMWWAGNNTANNEGTKEVGLKLPNPWGLYDMHGNIMEFCYDWYGEHPYNLVIDPTGSQNGNSKTYKGGSWNLVATSSRSAWRNQIGKDTRSNTIGFRIVATNPN